LFKLHIISVPVEWVAYVADVTRSGDKP